MRSCLLHIFLLSLTPASLARNTILYNEQNNPMRLDGCNFASQYVCGVKLLNELLDNQILQTFVNRCYACFHKDVSFYKEDICEIYPKNTRFCHPKIAEMAFCQEEFIDPVCGYFQLLQTEEQLGPTTFKNACEACKLPSLQYYLPGRCKDDIRE